MLAGFAPAAAGAAALVSGDFAASPALTAGTGGGGVSISSFWKSNTAICWFLPSSCREKSPFFRSSMTFPVLSFTVTSMITSVVFDVNVTGACCAGMFPNVRKNTSPNTTVFLIVLFPSFPASP